MNNNNEFINENVSISNLVDMENPQSVLTEVKVIIPMKTPEFDFKPLTNTFCDIEKLFNGKFPGYKSCNTEYHDLKHTTDTFLAMARLIHGYQIKKQLSESSVLLGLISALMHDTGYIQSLYDNFGTGAKYTFNHVTRGIFFLEKYLGQRDFSREEIKFCENCLNCTETDKKIGDIMFSTREEEITGKMLGTADVLSQMADRYYLEKLLFLYYEFREGNVLGYKTEFDILEKTSKFYNSTENRLIGELGNLKKYMIYHFKERWNVDRDLYMEGIEKNIAYLKYILDEHKKDYRDQLKRGNFVTKLNQKES